MTTDTQTMGGRAEARAKIKRRLLREVITQNDRYDELDDGFRLAYARRTIGDDTLRALRETWPQIDFALDPADENGEIGLRITGPPGTKGAFLPVLDADPSSFRDPSRWRLRWRARLLTSPLRALPNFIIIGTSKGGTTTLSFDLFAHPRVAPPRRKELFYFDRDYARGAFRYRAHFPTRLTRAFRRAMTGEASPTYLEHPRVPERVRQLMPNARLIAILRDPVDRAHSLHQLKTRTGVETLSLDDAIDREAEELDGELERVANDERYFSPLLHHCAYVWGGRYADHLERWTTVFPREQLLVLSSDDYRKTHDETYARVLDFLGLPPFTLPRQVDRNQGVYQPLAPTTRARLREIFRPHNERLWELLGVDWGWNDQD